MDYHEAKAKDVIRESFMKAIRLAADLNSYQNIKNPYAMVEGYYSFNSSINDLTKETYDAIFPIIEKSAGTWTPSNLQGSSNSGTSECNS